MKKLAKFVSYITLATLSGSAFARPNTGNPVLETLVANTDTQLAPAMNIAMEQYQAVTLPVPSMSRVESRRIQLIDITEKCTYQGEVVSAYPGIYKMFQSEENSRIIKVFGFMDSKGIERRVEVYFTGGDWMQYGLIYLITNAGLNKGQANAYFVSALSTTDRENGAVPPMVNPFDSEKLPDFIGADFLDAEGNVKTEFTSIAAAAAVK